MDRSAKQLDFHKKKSENSLFDFDANGRINSHKIELKIEFKIELEIATSKFWRLQFAWCE